MPAAPSRRRVGRVSCLPARRGARSAIEIAEENDFSLLRSAPRLRRICFNGKRQGSSNAALPRRAHILPSTSPAYTLAFARKVQLWKDARIAE